MACMYFPLTSCSPGHGSYICTFCFHMNSEGQTVPLVENLKTATLAYEICLHVRCTCTYVCIYLRIPYVGKTEWNGTEQSIHSAFVQCPFDIRFNVCSISVRFPFS